MHRLFRFAARAAAVLALAAAIAAAGAWWWLAQPLPLPTSPYAFDVKTGASLRSVGRELAAAGLVRSPTALVALARMSNVDRVIKAGNYEVATGVTLPQLLDKLTQGDVTEASLTVVEGSTYATLKNALAANPDVNKTVLDLTDAELMRRIGAEGDHPEGWFFPDTYFYSSGSTDLALLARAYRLMRARLDAAWNNRAPDLPLANPYEALILASIIEKETGNASDRPLIASVLVNRLRLGMRLQTDPTVIYGIGDKFDGTLKRRDLDADTSWNTYLHIGLPPTPIALPGQASLDAATHPPPTSFLYFVARGNGTSEFSANLADHNRAVAKYQKGRALP
jgi:UPF0755 protein